MVLEAQVGPTYHLGVTRYLSVRNTGSQPTRFEVTFGTLIEQKEVGPHQTTTFPTGSGDEQVSFKNSGPDILLVEWQPVVRAEHLPSHSG